MNENQFFNKYIYSNNKKLIFIISFLIGLFTFFSIYGKDVLAFTNIDWLLHSNDLEGSIDLTQHYLGWVFYRNTPWTFPIGLTEGLYQEPISVIYTDSIPLFALFFKILSPLLPTNFQYFGLYGLLCYSLLCGFSALVLSKFTKNSYFVFLGSFIITLNPVLLNRMFLHSALSAHWVLVAAICLWVYKDDISNRKQVILWSLLTSIATLLNAYFTPMVLGILCCSILSSVIKKDAIIIHLPKLLFSILFAFVFSYIMGMFYGKVPSSAGGLEYLSFNLDGFFNPFTYLTAFGAHTKDYTEFNYSSFLPKLPLTTPFQNEGFSYLGLGIILLGILCCFVWLITKGKKISLPLVVYYVVFLFLAVSPLCTFGLKEIYHIPYPNVIYNLLSTFRSTARFIWPVYYMTLLLVFVIIFRRIDTLKPVLKRFVCSLLILLCILQVVDLYPGLKAKHDTFAHLDTTYETPLKSQAWDYLGNNSSSILFYPPTQYGLYLDCETSTNFEIYALKYKLNLSNTYMSRDLTEYADASAFSHFEKREKGLRDSSIIYIFFDCIAYEDLPSSKKYGLNYYYIDGYTVGTELNLDQYALRLN